MVVMKEEAYTVRSSERGGRTCHVGSHGQAPEMVRRQRGEGRAWPAAFLGSWWRAKDKAGQGDWVVGLALENLNSSGWLWALGVVGLP